jgi:Mg-chelatase subunit ChlD
LTRTDLYGDAGAWAAWWKANREDFLAGRYNPAQPKREGSGRTTFFELPVISRRIVFVLDRSKSMAEGKPRKIDVVRAEMKALLSALPDGTRLNVIFFGDRLDTFAQSTRVLDARTRKEALDFMERTEPDGRTNLYDALDKALSLVGSPETGALRDEGVDTIFVLSDGAPTFGRISDAELILRRFTRENRFLRASVHTIAVGDVGTLLSRLADFNDGTSTQE